MDRANASKLCWSGSATVLPILSGLASRQAEPQRQHDMGVRRDAEHSGRDARAPHALYLNRFPPETRT